MKNEFIKVIEKELSNLVKAIGNDWMVQFEGEFKLKDGTKVESIFANIYDQVGFIDEYGEEFTLSSLDDDDDFDALDEFAFDELRSRLPQHFSRML